MNRLPAAAVVFALNLLPACSQPPTAPSTASATIPTPEPQAVTPAPTSFLITAPSTMLQGDPPAQASAVLTLSDDSHVDVKDLKCQATWSSSASDVARVNGQGVIEPSGFGDATIAVDCGEFHAESRLRVRRVFKVEGVVLEKHDLRRVPNATVTVSDGENAGMQTATDASGRFLLARLVDPTPTLRISGDEFEPSTYRIASGETGLEVHLNPRSHDRVLTIAPSDRYRERLFAFETHHSGPVTVTLHSDCLPNSRSFTWRMLNRVAETSSERAVAVVSTGLGSSDGDGGGETDSTETRVLPRGVYYQKVQGDNHCRWVASLRYPY